MSYQQEIVGLLFWHTLFKCLLCTCLPVFFGHIFLMHSEQQLATLTRITKTLIAFSQNKKVPLFGLLQ